LSPELLHHHKPTSGDLLKPYEAAGSKSQDMRN